MQEKFGTIKNEKGSAFIVSTSDEILALAMAYKF